MTYPSEAQRIIDKYTDSYPVKLSRIIEDFDIELRFVFRPDYSGRIFRIEEDRYRIECNPMHVKTRQRFTIAHELGHFFMDREDIDRLSMLEDNAIYRSGLSTEKEVRANKFAADLLMPMHFIAHVIDSSIKKKQPITPKDVAKLFEVSEQAIRIRLGIV